MTYKILIITLIVLAILFLIYRAIQYSISFGTDCLYIANIHHIGDDRYLDLYKYNKYAKPTSSSKLLYNQITNYTDYSLEGVFIVIMNRSDKTIEILEHIGWYGEDEAIGYFDLDYIHYKDDWYEAALLHSGILVKELNSRGVYIDNNVFVY